MTEVKCRCWKPTTPQLDCPIHKHEVPATMTPRLYRWVRKLWLNRPVKSDAVYVLITYRDGGTFMAGPMDQLAADIFIIHRLSVWPHYNGREVASTRLVLP